MIRKIEIEERALLDVDERDRILAHMHSLGMVIETKRVMINYSAGIPDESLELRIDDNHLSRVFKKRNSRGRWYEETESLDTSLNQALKSMAIEGHLSANISLRRRYEVVHRNLIYSLRDVLFYSNPKKHDNLSLFELEQDVFDGHDERSRTKIRQTMRRLKIEPLRESEFLEWVNKTHNNVDGTFTYSDGKALTLVMKLHRAGFDV